jgi:signal-transduction protein with cAMP-binding, CBS, and nucleotidyltransferase domain
MHKQVTDELHALDRVLYLLEEQSFQRLSMKDDDFASFIETLYAKVNGHATQLQTRST